MRRIIQLNCVAPLLVGLFLVALFMATHRFEGSPAWAEPDSDSEEEPGIADVWVNSCGEVSGVCVHAALQGWLEPVDDPSTHKPWRSHIVCVWFPYGKQPGGWDDPDGPVPVTHLQPYGLYALDCRSADNERVAGYPRAVGYTTPGEEIPGSVLSGWEVAEYSAKRLDFEDLVPVVAPWTQQIVGIDTWFTITSQLRDYPTKSAEAGLVWATVRASFVDVVWDFGSLGTLRCTSDADRTWNPRLSSLHQHSNCAKVFERSSGHVNATVTARWSITWRSSEHAGERFFRDYTLTEIVPLDVTEIQATIT